MAIKVQVKENGTSRVQPNLFNNGASMGINSYDFVGVQPTACMNGFGNWTTPSFNAWNTPITGINAMNTINMNPAFTSTSSLPYARQNAFVGQLPGMWQVDFAPQTNLPAGVNPWFSNLTPQQTAAMTNGMNGTGWNYTAAAT